MEIAGVHTEDWFDNRFGGPPAIDFNLSLDRTKHPGSKPPKRRAELRAKRKRERQARKRGRR